MATKKYSALGGVERNPIHAAIERNAIRFAHRPFVESIDQQKTIRFDEFRDAAARVAYFLDDARIMANDRVMLIAENSIEQLLAFFGTLYHGATLCAVNLEANRHYLDEIFAAIAPKVVLYQESPETTALPRSGAEWIRLGEWNPRGGSGFFASIAGPGKPPEPEPVNQPTDDAYIMYTSGTASKPKGVVARYNDLQGNMEGLANALGLGPDDRLLEFRSLAWASGLMMVQAVMSAGATLLLARKFSQSRYFDWLKEHRATVGICNPTGIAMFINRPVGVKGGDLPHLRFMTSSSAPLTLEHWKNFESTYAIPIAQGYGCSEAIGFIAASNEKSRKMGSVGRPIPFHQLKVVGRDGKPLGAGETGEVEIGGPPDKEFRYLEFGGGPIRVAAQGRYRTGDVGFLDEDGFLCITGRVKELIIRGGVNISPVEIDNVLVQMDGVAEAAAVGVPDRIYGEEVVAYVACKSGLNLTKEAVMAHCGEKLPAFKRPKEIIFKASLPKTDRGKLDRKALAEEWKLAHPA